MDVLRWSRVPVLLLVFSLLAVVETYKQSETTSDTLLHRIYRGGEKSNSSQVENSEQENGTGESNVDWLGRHWYVFVVLLVVVIVIFVFVCGCLVRRSRLGHHHMQMYQNGNPSTSTSNYPNLARTMHLPYHPPQNSSIPTEDAVSSISRHTETSFMGTSNSVMGRGSLSVDAPPIAPPPSNGASDSPWSLIQSVAKAKGRKAVEVGEVRRGGGRGVSSGRVKESLEQSSRQSDHRTHPSHHHHSHHHRSHHHHSHHHRSHHHHSLSYLRGYRQHTSHHRHLSTKVNGVKDDSGASLCSLPSTSGSMQSDQSNHSSNRSNQLRSSHSHSDNSTIVEVNLNVRLSPNQLDRAKVVTMAALAESARKLAESAADFGREQAHTRSLPHSPCSPPRSYLRYPRHSVTGAPITPHSLPPSSLHEHKHRFHSHSSSHLLPRRGSSDVVNSRPSSPRTRQTISLDRKNTRHYHPINYGTEDEGTVVSLDHNSSSSSCHCPSLVAYDQGQRSLINHSPGMMGAAIVSLDQYSNEEANSEADTTVVSLDHYTRSANQEPQKTDAVSSHDTPRSGQSDHGSSSYSGNSTSVSVTNSSSHIPYHVRQDNTRTGTNLQQMTHLNLDSQIEDTPLIKQQFCGNSLELYPPSTRASNAWEDRLVVNGYSYHTHIPASPFPHSHPITPSPKLGLHQQLHNISEQGESECFPSSDNFDMGDEPSGQYSDEHKVHASSRDPLGGPSLLQQSTELEKAIEQKAETRTRDKKKRGKRRKTRHQESKSGARETPSGRDGINMMMVERDSGSEEDFVEEVPCEISGDTKSPDHLQDSSFRVTPPCRTSSPQQNTTPPPSSPSLDKTQSPPRSGSALSVSEALGSTASGYAATGESESTCSVEVKKDECFSEFEDIQKALFDARSQFSYPLQRLLDQECELDSTGMNTSSKLDLGSGFQPVMSHSNVTRSHAGSDSDQFQTHSMPLAYRNKGHSRHLQQIQSVDV